jgi:hypothetical protein
VPKLGTPNRAETFESVQTAIGGGEVDIGRAQLYLVGDFLGRCDRQELRRGRGEAGGIRAHVAIS